MSRNKCDTKNIYGKKTYALFVAWMVLYTAALAVYSCYPACFTLLGAGKTVGLLSCVALDLLFLLIYLTENVYWIGCVSYEEAAAAGTRARKRFALRQLAIFLAATVLFLLYCFWLPQKLYTSSTFDSMAAGAVVCVGAVISCRIKL